MLTNLKTLLKKLRRNFHYRSLRANNVWIDSTALIDGVTHFNGYNKVYSHSQIFASSLGRFSYVGPQSVLANCDVGAFCSIGPEVRIGPGLHPTNWISTHPAFYSQRMQAGLSFAETTKCTESLRTSVGADVWIGARVIVMDGVKIGRGSVIAAGAVVTKDVRPYAIVGGVPAQLIRQRFDAATISDLEDWEWWNLPLEDLRKLAKSFSEDRDWSVTELKKRMDIRV